MEAFEFETVEAVLLADGPHRPDKGSLRFRTATRWIDGEPRRMLEWTEDGTGVYTPVPNVLAIRSAPPSTEAPRPAPRDPFAELLEGSGRASFSTVDAAKTNDLYAGRPGGFR